VHPEQEYVISAFKYLNEILMVFIAGVSVVILAKHKGEKRKVQDQQYIFL
jgi:hypothetical protein